MGYCHLRDAIRTFSLSRIITAKKTGNSFQVPEGFDFQKLTGSHFGIHWGDGEVEVTIRFNMRVADYVRERVWHVTQKLEDCKNGDVILSLTVNHLLELKRWVLSWGNDAQVLSPDGFIQDIRQTLQQAARGYE